MPLIKGKSRKDFDKNLKTELSEGKPKDQSLAIAYSIKRKSPKKMADGGRITADSSDSDELDMIKGKESPMQVPRAASERMPTIDNITPEEMNMIHRHRIAMAEGGMIPNFKDEGMNSIDSGQSQHGKNMLDGRSTMGRQEKDWTSDGHTTIDDASTDRNKNMMSKNPPGRSQVSRAASSRPSIDDAKTDRNEDMLSQKSSGGWSGSEDENDAEKSDYNTDFDMVSHIMKKRKKFAEGGMVDLQKNANEEKNNEDDLSYDALRKDTYFDDSQLDKQPMDSNEHGDDLEDEDSHDMVGSIRKRMKMKKVGQ